MLIENAFSTLRDNVITLQKVLNRTVPFVLYREGKLSMRIARFPLKEDGSIDRKGDRLEIKDGERFPVTIRIQKNKHEVSKEMMCLFEVHSSSGHLLAANVLPFCEQDTRELVSHKDKTLTKFEEVLSFLGWFLAENRSKPARERALSLKSLKVVLPRRDIIESRFKYYQRQVEKGEEIMKRVKGTLKEEMSNQILEDNLDRLLATKRLLNA